MSTIPGPGPFLPQMEPSFGEEEAAAVAGYLREGGWITEFKRTEAFEQAIAAYVGAAHCVVVNNGTVSLTLAALACGIGPGDEVLVPDYTMIATPNSVKLLGAVPVFVDVEPETLCLDLARCAAALTPRTRAVMLVTANGRSPRAGVLAFEAFCAEHGLSLIEDAAQSLGSRFPDGRHCGLSGRVGSFSFSAPKVISTGQGGALVTMDAELAQRLRRLKDFGRARGGVDVHDSVGFNFKFTDLQACVGLEQMKKLPGRVERKREIYRRYQEGLRDVPEVGFFAQELAHTTPWFVDVQVQEQRRDALAAHLQARGIGTRVMYPPIHRQRAYDLPGSYPVAERVGRDGLWLPSSAQLTDAQVDRVVEVIRAFF